MTPEPRRRALLIAALACTRLQTTAPEVAMVLRWLDTWSGTGAVIVGIIRQGYRVSLSCVAQDEWRAVFSSHPLTSPDGFAVERTPWRVVQRAAWDALKRAS